MVYAKTFVAKWGDADGTKLMPGALGYTVWLVQPDGTLGARLFGRECWGPVVAAAIGLGARDDLREAPTLFAISRLTVCR